MNYANFRFLKSDYSVHNALKWMSYFLLAGKSHVWQPHHKIGSLKESALFSASRRAVLKFDERHFSSNLSKQLSIDVIFRRGSGADRFLCHNIIAFQIKFTDWPNQGNNSKFYKKTFENRCQEFEHHEPLPQTSGSCRFLWVWSSHCSSGNTSPSWKLATPTFLNAT